MCHDFPLSWFWSRTIPQIQSDRQRLRVFTRREPAQRALIDQRRIVIGSKPHDLHTMQVQVYLNTCLAVPSTAARPTEVKESRL